MHGEIDLSFNKLHYGVFISQLIRYSRVCGSYLMEYISLSWLDIPEHVVPIRISLIEGCC